MNTALLYALAALLTFSTTLTDADAPTDAPTDAQTGYAIMDPRECSSIVDTNLAAWYRGDSFDSVNNLWSDLSGNSRDAPVSGSTVAVTTATDAASELFVNGEAVVYGDPVSGVVFGEPNFMSHEHTLFHVCKYRVGGTNKRIIQGMSYNFLSGFWEGRSGVAYDSGWITQYDASTFGTEWVLSSQQRSLYRGNGNDLTSPSFSNTHTRSTALSINAGWLAEHGDWACAEIIVVNAELSIDDIGCVERYLSDRYGIDGDNPTSSAFKSASPTQTPSQTPSQSPTGSPTQSPSQSPTDAPTNSPTGSPTAAPTQTCNDTTDIKHVNWMELSRDESLAPYANVKMEHVAADLVLLIDVELEYVGDSYGSRLEQRGYGTTYVLDFESLNAHDSTSSPLSAPGTCSNRKASDKTFEEMWNYSLSPNLNGEIGSSDTNLAYPEPSAYWTVEMKNGSECTRIVYKGEFDLNELRECADGLDNSKKFLHFVDVHEWMNISGTFYVNLVSPMNKETDTGYHYVYQLVSAPFVMAIKKNVYFVSSTGISLFAMTFVAVYKDTDETKYTLMLLTESNDHLQLSIRRLLTSPDDSGVQIDNNDSESGCLVGRNNMCMQLFKVSAPNVECANDRFSGQYGIRFDIACVATLATNSAGFKHCTDWLAAETEENGDDTVDLFIDLEFTDDICDAQIFVIKFNAEMSFYKDADFTANQTDTRNGYAVGVDHIYVSVKLNFSEKAFSIIKTRLINVWLCTINESIYSIDAVSQTGATSGGGCHSHNIAQVYHIVEDTDAQVATGYEDYNIVIYDRTADSFHENEVRVSFKVPKDVEYGKLYVHVHIKIGLLADTITARRRRRLLAETEPAKADQMRHFMDSTDIRQDIASDGGQTEEGVMSSDNKHTTQHYLICVMLALVMIFE